MSKKAQNTTARRSERFPSKEDMTSAGLNCVNFNLRRASRAVTQFYDRELEQAGLTSQRFSLLHTLGASDGLELSVLADLLVMDRTTLLRNLSPLEELGYVSDIPSDTKRARKVALTDKGLEALRIAYPIWEKAQDAVISAMGEDDLKRLLKRLNSIVRKRNFKEFSKENPS
ncbi:MarR family transcriptional regulator [Leptospira langatensis]|uniref:MarR family transcriptional regulator n=1 Tax=Leptospira langatensis TaxID=2484983 RepID=A0A5F1ZQR2_9LEPT|nr:MarR family winged helix-turn-helix transcriptional regulator [Leptospira langatensis]TGK02770.1 MarR family transcriptional regulator [Leptospira langatensis]TGL40025.1 MarR family transcriptional regulator [Leptospira langatensis]